MQASWPVVFSTERSMAGLEDIKPGVSVRGIGPQGFAKIVKVEWYGDQAIKVLYDCLRKC